MQSIIDLIKSSSLTDEEYDQISEVCKTLKDDRTKTSLVQKVNDKMKTIEKKLLDAAEERKVKAAA